MNPLREMIINEIVRPEIRAATEVYIGTIETFYSSTNTADVRLGVAMDEQYKGVPFSRGASYVYGVEPQLGTPVIVAFLNKDKNYPYIVSILTDSAADMTTGKSTMVPDVSMLVKFFTGGR